MFAAKSFAAFVLLLLMAVCATAGKGSISGSNCELPPPEGSASFWLKVAGGTSSTIAAVLGHDEMGSAIDTFVEVADTWMRGDPPTEFDYLSCMLQQVDHKLDMILKQLDEIKQLIVVTKVLDEVNIIETAYQQLMYMMQTAGNSSRAALKATMEDMFNNIISQNVIAGAANLINRYLTQSPSQGVDPLLLTISKNSVREDIVTYYVSVKQQASAYWDTLSKAANLMRYASRYKNQPAYEETAKAIEKQISDQGAFLEENEPSVIPRSVRNLARNLLQGVEITGTMKIRYAKGGFQAIESNVFTHDIYNPAWISAGKRGSFDASTPVRFTRLKSTDPNADLSLLHMEIKPVTFPDNVHTRNFVSAGMGVISWGRGYSENAWGLGFSNSLRLYVAGLPTTLVSKDWLPDHYYIAEFVNGQLKYTCGDDNQHRECPDALMSDRGDYDSLVDDDNCWFDIQMQV
jgi:hypothetical protein